MNKNLELIQPSASMELVAKAKSLNKNIINLAGGEPNFNTPLKISIATIQSLLSNNTHYTTGPCNIELSKQIANKLQQESNIICDYKNIILTPGAKFAIYLAINTIINPEDEVIIINPSWVSYAEMVKAVGGIPKYIDDIDLQKLENIVSNKTKLIIINYPNNPTGKILHQKEALILETFLLKYENIYLLSDEVYDDIVYNQKSISMGSFSSISERVITVNGFSKSYAMTGWRLGYVVGNNEFFKNAYKFYQHTITCINPFLQAGALAALSCHNEVLQMCQEYKQRRDYFVNELNKIPNVSCELPEGTFYAWVKFNVDISSTKLCQYLITEANVIGVPGEAYGEIKETYLRFSFANDLEDLKMAVQNIKKAMLKLN